MDWKMPDFMKQKFRDCRLSPGDIAQIEHAAKKTTFELNGKRISAPRAFELCGEEKFWRGMERSAFHASAVQETAHGKIGFDSRKFFKE